MFSFRRYATDTEESYWTYRYADLCCWITISLGNPGSYNWTRHIRMPLVWHTLPSRLGLALISQKGYQRLHFVIHCCNWKAVSANKTIPSALSYLHPSYTINKREKWRNTNTKPPLSPEMLIDPSNHLSNTEQSFTRPDASGAINHPEFWSWCQSQCMASGTQQWGHP